MYLVALIVVATFLLSIFTNNWPLRLYQRLYLRNLAHLLTTNFQKPYFIFGSELCIPNRNQPIRIRFLNGSFQQLKTVSGLEIRLSWSAPVVMEIYDQKIRKQEWGEFKRVDIQPGNLGNRFDMLSPDPIAAKDFWLDSKLNILFQLNPVFTQLSFTKKELIFYFKNYPKAEEIIAIVAALAGKDS